MVPIWRVDDEGDSDGDFARAEVNGRPHDLLRFIQMWRSISSSVRSVLPKWRRTSWTLP